jgi:hypothetical protein
MSRLLGLWKDGTITWGGHGLSGIPVWAPPPGTPVEDGGAFLSIPAVPGSEPRMLVPYVAISDELIRSVVILGFGHPRMISIEDDQGNTVSGLNNRDDEQIALDAIAGNKSFRSDYMAYRGDRVAFAKLETARRSRLRRPGLAQPPVVSAAAMVQNLAGRLAV